MGIHGLTTYLRENRSTLAHALEFGNSKTQESRTTVVVDAWSFIYETLAWAELPWVYGGEYDAFSKIIVQVVEAWLDVGLILHFVFDGPYPALKFPTLVSRTNEVIQSSLLFFRTSPAARSTARFLRETALLPPFSYNVCVRTLQTLAAEKNAGGETLLELHFADEEGDPYAVALAGRLNAYVAGHDSDYVVLNSEGYRGYLPLNEMVWTITTPLSALTSPTESVFSSVNGDAWPAEDGFRVVRSSKSRKRATQSVSNGQGLIPPHRPPDSDLSLSVTVYSPMALADHLQLSVSLLPLLGALVGNDFTGNKDDPSQGVSLKRSDLQRLFFDRHLSVTQRITHTANTLRTILSTASSNKPRRGKKPIGSVTDLIEAAVDTLLIRPPDTLATGEREAIIERIIDATLQYAIRPHEVPEGGQIEGGEDGRAIPSYASDVCALHTRETCSFLALLSNLHPPKTIAVLSDFSSPSDCPIASGDAELLRAEARDLYVEAYRRGAINPHITNALATGTMWPRPFLEDPDKETVLSTIGRPIREWIYAVLLQSIGLPSRPGEEEEEAEEADEDELVDVVEEDDDVLAPLRGALERLDRNKIDGSNDAEEDSTVPAASTVRHRTVTEYVRRGTRAVGEEVPVYSLPEMAERYSIALLNEVDGHIARPIQLWSEEERFTFMLRVLQSDTARIRSLGGDSLMGVLALRSVATKLHARAEENGASRVKEQEKWTKDEARAFLAAFSEMSLEQRAVPLDVAVPVVERSIQLVAQVSAAMEALEHFVQILLLRHRVPSPLQRFSGQWLFWALANDDVPVMIEDNILDATTEDISMAFRDPATKKKQKERKNKELLTSGQPSQARKQAKSPAVGKGSIFSLLGDAAA